MGESARTHLRSRYRPASGIRGAIGSCARPRCRPGARRKSRPGEPTDPARRIVDKLREDNAALSAERDRFAAAGEELVRDRDRLAAFLDSLTRKSDELSVKLAENLAA